jgi:hypothetical protein
MKLFKEIKLYTIVADKAAKIDVWKFVNKYHVKRRKPDVIDATDYSVIDLRTTEERNIVIELIKNEFERKFKVEIGENLIWITNNQEP